MPVSPDIQRAIEIIEQRIQSLLRIKEMLLKEFGIEEQRTTPQQPTIWDKIPDLEKKRPRKEALVDYLRQHGPATRAEIAKDTEMPRGTLAFLLNDKDTFHRSDDGRWAVRQK